MSVVLVFSLLLGAKLFFFIWQYSVNILFWDQWDLYSAFFDKVPLRELFVFQHGPHRQGIGFFLTKILADLTHWNTRIESLAVGGVVFLAMLFAFQLKKHLFGSFYFSDVIIPLIFLTPAQFETFIGTPNVSHGAFPILLAMLYGLSWTYKKQPLRYVAMLTLNFVMIYTGFGFFMGLITVMLLLFGCFQHRQDNRALIISSVALVVALGALTSFFLIGYTFAPAVDCFVFPHPRIWEYAWFVGLMFANFFGLKVISVKVISSGFGIGVLILCLSVLIYHGGQLIKGDTGSRNISLIIVILTGYSLLFCFSTAIGRICLGLGGAQSSRYMTLLIPVFLGLYFHFVSIRGRGKRHGLIAVYTMLLIFGSFLAPLKDKPSLAWYSNGKQAWKRCYLENENIEECDRAVEFKIYPVAEGTHLKEKLDYLKKNKLNLYLHND